MFYFSKISLRCFSMERVGSIFHCSKLDFMDLTNILSSGLSGAAGSLLGGIFGAIGAKKQYKRQKSLMKLQSQMEMDNWQQQFDAQNAYNDPSAQLERLEAAGINPLNQDGGFANTSEGASGASVGLPNPSVPDFSSISQIGNNLQDAFFRSKQNEREERKQNNEDRLTDVQIQQAYSVIDNYKANTKHTEEETQNAIQSRDLIVANTKKVLSDIESSNIQTQISIQDLALRQYQTEIDKAYKAGMLDVEGSRNDIAREANAIKAAELDEKRREFNEQTKFEREKFQQAIKDKKFEVIEKAIDKLHYEVIGGVVTGIAPESLYTANGLLQAFGIDSNGIIPDYRGKEYGIGSESATFVGSVHHAVSGIIDIPTSLYKKIDLFAKDLESIRTASSVDATTGAQ